MKYYNINKPQVFSLTQFLRMPCRVGEPGIITLFPLRFFRIYLPRYKYCFTNQNLFLLHFCWQLINKLCITCDVVFPYNEALINIGKITRNTKIRNVVKTLRYRIYVLLSTQLKCGEYYANSVLCLLKALHALNPKNISVFNEIISSHRFRFTELKVLKVFMIQNLYATNTSIHDAFSIVCRAHH